MLSQTFFCIFTLLCLNKFILEVNGTLPSALASIRRNQPIRLPESYKINGVQRTHSRSGSVSSFSPSQSKHSMREHHTIESEVEPSTSTGKRGDVRDFKEVELEPIIESSKHVSFIKSVDLSDASTATHSHGNINPIRDGVFARVRSAVLRFGAAVVVGTAVGAGGAVIDRQFIHTNADEMPTVRATTQAATTWTTTEQIDDEMYNSI